MPSAPLGPAGRHKGIEVVFDFDRVTSAFHGTWSSNSQLAPSSLAHMSIGFDGLNGSVGSVLSPNPPKTTICPSTTTAWCPGRATQSAASSTSSQVIPSCVRQTSLKYGGQRGPESHVNPSSPPKKKNVIVLHHDSRPCTWLPRCFFIDSFPVDAIVARLPHVVEVKTWRAAWADDG